MPRRRSYTSYSSYYGRERERRIPSPIPYVLIALLAGAGLAYFHFIVFKSLSGRVLNAYSGAPMSGVALSVQSGPGAGAQGEPQTVTSTLELTATTGADGTFGFERLPPNPVLSVSLDGYTAQQMPVEGMGNVEVKLVPNVLRGKVSTADGQPVAGATIWAGSARTQTGADGTYLLKDIPAERKLVIKAPGYLSHAADIGQVETLDVTLEPFVARAIYLNADSIATPGKLQALLDLVDRTELTAVVIDVKADNSGLILYDSKLPLVQELGVTNQLIPDLSGLLKSLKEKKIYTIARISVFWDQALTGAKPDWALKSKKAPGQVWVDAYGKRWSNPFVAEVWDYNISIAREVAERGFNEIQFDNAHFPSDGDLADIDFGPAQAGRKRVDAISQFLEKAQNELAPLAVYVASNVFGLTPFVSDDMGVGQNWETVASHVDYICPAIYPANFGDGFMNFPKPAEHPGEIVSQTMKAGVARLGNARARIRPWLQDFSTQVKYEAPHVRAEIDAAEQNRGVGWMLWNFGNEYTAGALKAAAP